MTNEQTYEIPRHNVNGRLGSIGIGYTPMIIENTPFLDSVLPPIQKPREYNGSALWLDTN